jgi:transcriptional regulator with XRE-family HTH domain
MGLRTNPTQRQKRLGHELRKLREAAGMTTAEAGRHVGLGQAHLSHIEAGRTACVEPRLRALAQLYGCRNDPLIETLVSMSNADGKGWWTSYRQIVDERGRDLAELESTATAFRVSQWLYVPGLLQTRDYMRELFLNGDPGGQPEVIERQIEFRLRRQQVLSAEREPQCHAVIHEAMFHMHFVSRATMRGQLRHLVEQAQRPNVTIQLIPFKAESHPVTPGAPFTIHHSPAPELRTVYVEQPITPLFLGDQRHIDQFTTAFERLTMVALAPLDPAEPLEENSLGLVQHLRYVL